MRPPSHLAADWAAGSDMKTIEDRMRRELLPPDRHPHDLKTANTIAKNVLLVVKTILDDDLDNNRQQNHPVATLVKAAWLEYCQNMSEQIHDEAYFLSPCLMISAR